MAGRIALVTGAASGIGWETCLLLAREGATVLVTDIDAKRASVTAREIEENGGYGGFTRLDVTQEADW